MDFLGIKSKAVVLMTNLSFTGELKTRARKGVVSELPSEIKGYWFIPVASYAQR